MQRTPIRRWFRRHDPQGSIARRATRAALVVTLALFIGDVLIKAAEVTTFAVFGCFALLLFVEFPGSRTGRLGSYLMLGIAGACLITVGTLMSRPGWLAVVGMALFGFVIFFAGVISAATAAATRSALLTFVLPVCVPGAPADIAPRLGGWGVALVLSVPAAMLLWPPKEHDELRESIAEVCRAVGAHLNRPNSSSPDLTKAVTKLRTAFRATAGRPAGLTTGGRLLIRAVDQLDWLRSAAAAVDRGMSENWSAPARELVQQCSRTLEVAAAVVRGDGGSGPALPVLTEAIKTLERTREAAAKDQVTLFLGTADLPGDHLAQPHQVHEIAYATDIVGRTLALAGAADARPVLSRLLGRPVSDPVPVTALTIASEVSQSALGPVAAGGRLVRIHSNWRSVWFQNSIRGGVGLSAAVAAVELTNVQHGFWVVLGAMSILRSTAMNTSTTALRAVIGTTAGFVLGAGAVLAVGTNPVALWIMLPLAVLIAGFVPEALSFAAGQAAFTVTVVILFNIIDPIGWEVGLIRIEDVGIGAATGIVVGLLLWPRGAAGQISHSLAQAYRASGAALLAVTTAIHTNDATGEGALERAKAAGERVEDAFRQYLSDRGGKPVKLSEITAAVNGANRTRLAAEAIHALGRSGRGFAESDKADVALNLVDLANESHRWFDDVAELLATPGSRTLATLTGSAEQLATSRLIGTKDPAWARTLWATALYLDDVRRMQNRLVKPLTALTGSMAQPVAAKGAKTPAGSYLRRIFCSLSKVSAGQALA